MDLTTLLLLKDKYILMCDPTEYYFATRVIGDWDQWEEICNNKDIRPTIEQWRRELESKIKSDSLARIIDAAKGETRDALAANKFLLDIPWLKEDSRRGRPTKLDVLSEAHKIASEEHTVVSDYNRLLNKEDT